MSALPEQVGAAELARLRALAQVGSRWAAAAFSQLVEVPVWAETPQLKPLDAPPPDGPWEAGVFFEAEGDVAGLIALLLAPPTRDTVLERLFGRPAAELPAGEAESALRELGNIVASKTVSGMADSFGGRVLLSVPSPARSDAIGALLRRIAWRAEGAAGLRIDAELRARDESLRALLVFVPDPLKPDAT
jgi:chemotaxis protein CheY-P-specific phosphatase CheC